MTIDACTTGFVAIGSLAAVVGVLSGNRTAYALLASAIFSTVLCEAGVPFQPSLWLTIDLTVIMWIFVGWADAVLQGSYGRRRDLPILGIFALIWPLYFVSWEYRAAAVDVLVAVQMLLTFPFRRTWERVKGWAEVNSDNGSGPLRLAPA